jgi:hypothetical protein
MSAVHFLGRGEVVMSRPDRIGRLCLTVLGWYGFIGLPATVLATRRIGSNGSADKKRFPYAALSDIDTSLTRHKLTPFPTGVPDAFHR